MKEVETGNFDVNFPSNVRDEVGRLGEGINHMLQRIRELVSLVYIEQNNKRRAELTALQSQINPHFLYNTLETINSLARKNNEREISRMIVLLGKLLRNSVSIVHDLIPISKELEHVRNYFEIHKHLIKEHISYEIDISPEIQKLFTIKWILQPIVENSIVHGSRNRPDGIHISISGNIINDKVFIKVKDNGVGMSKEELNLTFDFPVDFRAGFSGFNPADPHSIWVKQPIFAIVVT